MNTENKNIALVGCGGASGPFSFPIRGELQQGYTVKMVVAADAAAAALLAAAWPEARIITDLQEVLSDASIGLVIVSEGGLPPSFAGDCLRAGKSVRLLQPQPAGRTERLLQSF